MCAVDKCPDRPRSGWLLCEEHIRAFGLDPPAPNAPEPELRPDLRAFASAMEKELRENDHKAGWKDDSVQWLLSRLCEEVAELIETFDVEPTKRPDRVGPREAFAIAANHLDSAARILQASRGTITTRGAVRVASLMGRSSPTEEAADVANFAMMIADVASRLPRVKSSLDRPNAKPRTKGKRPS